MQKPAISYKALSDGIAGNNYSPMKSESNIDITIERRHNSVILIKRLSINFTERLNKDQLYLSAISILKCFHREYEYPFWSKGAGCYFSKTHMFELNACNIIPELMEIILFNENNVKKIKNRKYNNDVIIPIQKNR